MVFFKFIRKARNFLVKWRIWNQRSDWDCKTSHRNSKKNLSVPDAHTEAQIIAAKRGRISLFGGIPGNGKGYLDSNLVHYKELSIHGVHATTADLMRQIIHYVESGKLDLEKYITDIYSLDNILDGFADGFAAIRDRNAMKVLIKP